MIKYTPAEIIRRFDRLWSDRKIVEQEWQAIELFIRPYSGKFFREQQSESSIEWRRRNIYDSTAVMACQSLASSLHGVMTSPAMRWFGFQFRQDELKENHEASVWLEQSALETYDTLQDSNFNLEVNETYLDITSFGTGFLLEEPIVDIAKPWEGVEFSGIPIKEAYFEEDEFGQVKTFYRHMEWTASRVISKFGEKNVPDVVKKAHESGSDQKFDIIFCIYPRDNADDNNTDKILPPDKRPWGYQYVFKTDKTPIGEEGGYYEMPVYAPRWLTSSESRWGHSPATIALADVLTLNQLVELVLKAAEKVIDPTILAEERAILADLDLGAGKINVVRKIDGLKPFESGSRMDIGQLRIDDLRAAINKYFFVDQLALKDSPAMTATEVQVRYELMHRLMSGTMARLRNDLLDPLVGRTFRLLYRSGRLDPIPDVIEESGLDIDIEYIGPLSRAQLSDQSTATERWLGQVAAMAEINPEVVMIPDWDAIVRESARNLNVPSKLLKGAKEVKKDMDDMREKQAQQAQAETAVTETKAAEQGANAEATREATGDNTLQ